MEFGVFRPWKFRQHGVEMYVQSCSWESLLTLLKEHSFFCIQESLSDAQPALTKHRTYLYRNTASFCHQGNCFLLISVFEFSQTAFHALQSWGPTLNIFMEMFEDDLTSISFRLDTYWMPFLKLDQQCRFVMMGNYTSFIHHVLLNYQ